MKRQDPELIGDVLRQTLQQQGMTGRLYETRAVALWPAVVGEEIAALCGRPYVNDAARTSAPPCPASSTRPSVGRLSARSTSDEAAGDEGRRPPPRDLILTNTPPPDH